MGRSPLPRPDSWVTTPELAGKRRNSGWFGVDLPLGDVITRNFLKKILPGEISHVAKDEYRLTGREFGNPQADAAVGAV